MFGTGFGNKEPEQQTSNAFGSNQTTNNSLFGSQSQTPNQQSSNMFGTSLPQTEPVACSFGSAQGVFGSMFGQSQNQPNPQSTFGFSQLQVESQPSNFGHNQTQSSSTFGQPSNQPNQPNPQSRSTFGFSQPQAEPQPMFGGGCFGSTAPSFGMPAQLYHTTPFGNFHNRFGVPVPRRLHISPYISTRKLRTYNLYLTIETSEYKADTLLIINSQDHFKLSSSILSQTCNYFRELEPESELSVTLPTNSLVYEFFLFLNYRHIQDLIDKINSVQDILDLYILLNKFEYKQSEIILDAAFAKGLSGNLSPLTSYLPKEWHKDYIDFDFCIRLSRSYSTSLGIFGNLYTLQPITFLAYLIIWLGYDTAKSRHELDELLNSEEGQAVRDYIEVYNYYPTDHDQLFQLLSRFPQAINLFNHDKLLKKLKIT